MKRRVLGHSLLASSLLLSSACREPDETGALLEALRESAVKPAHAAEAQHSVDINPRLLRRFRPLHAWLETPDNPITEAKTALGHQLFFDTRLSKNQDVSCNTCHALDHYGVDGRPTSVGHRGQHGTRNAPSVYNAAGFFAEFWDGRADTVEQQALGPILNPVEMAMPDGESVVQLLDSIPEYRAAFKLAFPDDPRPLTFANVGRAIGAFERRLTTRARWDDYLSGNAAALNDAELEGLKIFTNIGCMVCHTGEFVGGAMFQKVGVVEPWPNQTDQGRYEVTKQEADRMMFKVPTLRNVAKTAPYFHDGSVATLDQAVRMMGKHQLGLKLSDHEVTAIVSWLSSLTGSVSVELSRPPTLPPNGPTTPPADPR